MKIKDEAVEAGTKACRDITFNALTMDECRDAVRKSLEAALPHLSQGAVRVKPLEWVDLGDGKVFRAFLPVIGGIRIEPYGACGWWEVLWSMPGQCDKLIPDVFDTADEAKAAAQADYERRVLSALSPAPVGVSEEMLIAAFLRGENWRRRNDVDRYISVPEMVEKAARDYADATLSALASHEPAPTVANAELQQEVETLREGIKEIAEREQSIRDNWARYEESTKARILELETDLEIANDLIRKKDEALRNIRELNFTHPGADGLRWARSDLIEQEIVFALGGQSNG